MTPIDNDEIVIGFSTAQHTMSPIAPMIRAFEDTPYSHMYMRYWAPQVERDMIYQANIDDVNFTNTQHFLYHNKVIDEYAFKITPEIKKAVIQKCIDRLHLKYGKMQLVGMATAQIWHKWTGTWIKNPFRDGTKTQVCSELAGHVLYEMGYPVELEKLEVLGPKWLHGKIEGLAKLGHCRKL
jgi:hypothetical protein